MTEEKTIAPSKKKLLKARQRGEVPKSASFAAALIFVGGILIITTLYGNAFQKTMQIGLSQVSLDHALKNLLAPLVFPTVMSLLLILALAIGAHLLQTGWIWAPEQIMPKWRKKKRSIRLIYPLLQLAVIAAVGYWFIRRKLAPKILFDSPQSQLGMIFHTLFDAGMIIGALLLFLGICDLFYQKWLYHNKMHMTPQEKRDEQRESEVKNPRR